MYHHFHKADCSTACTTTFIRRTVLQKPTACTTTFKQLLKECCKSCLHNNQELCLISFSRTLNLLKNAAQTHSPTNWCSKRKTNYSGSYSSRVWSSLATFPQAFGSHRRGGIDLAMTWGVDVINQVRVVNPEAVELWCRGARRWFLTLHTPQVYTVSSIAHWPCHLITQ